MALPQQWSDILAGRNTNLRLGVVQDESGRPMVTAMNTDGEAVGDMLPLDQVTGQSMPNPYGGGSPASTITYDEQSGQFGDAQDPAVTAYLNANYPGMGLVHQNLGADRFLDPSKVYDTPYGRVTSQANVRAGEDSFLDRAINPLTVFSLMMGVPTLPGGGSGFSSLGNLITGGNAAPGIADFASATGIENPASWGNLQQLTDLGNGAAAGSALPGAVAPVSDAGMSVGDPFIDAYTPISSNVPQGTWAPTPGVGNVASAINKLLGTSLTDTDVSTGVKVGTTAAGLLAGSGATGGADPLPGSDTSGLDAAKARTRASIAGMFEGQDPRYQGIRDSVLGFQKSNLDRDREEAARKLKFSLLRTGNAGGSLQVDETSKLGRTYDRGLLDATNLADQAAQSARSSDASTKLDLLGRVDSGLDQDAATSAAAEQMRLAGDRATSQGLGTTLGNVFADAGLMFQTDAAKKGLTDARRAFQNMFSTVPGSSGGSYTGITGRA